MADWECKNCQYYSPQYAGADEGECRRNPPVFVVGSGSLRGYWPMVNEFGCCGEYRVFDEVFQAAIEQQLREI